MSKFLERNLLWLSIVTGVFLLIALGVFAYFQLPPREFTILTGREGGAYYSAALEYQQIAAEKGFTLNVVPTAGSLEVLERMQRGEAEVGFVQGGTATGLDVQGLSTAASVFYEPLWVMVRTAAFPNGAPIRFDALAGKRVNVGEDGSGTQVLAHTLLQESGVPVQSYEESNLGSADAIDALARGDLDAAFFVVSPRSDLVRRLFDIPGVELMSIDLADAYAARHRYLSVITLPHGVVDPAAVIPPQNVTIVSTVANVIVNDDIHPDLLRLLSVAMVRTHEAGGLLEEPREFPNLDYAELPINKVQLAFIERFKAGESTLDNYLPFWAASIVDRYLLFVVPIALIVLPIISRSPLVYTSFIRMRIRRRYRMMRDIDARIPHMGLEEIDLELDRIDELDQRMVHELQVANQFMPEVFELRSHLDLLEIKLRRRRDKLAGTLPASPAGSDAEATPLSSDDQSAAHMA